MKTPSAALIWCGSGRATFASARRNEGVQARVEGAKEYDMQDDNSDLPEGTDKIISGASTPTSAGGEEGDVLLVADLGEPTGRAAMMEKLRSSREKLSSQAADKTRGLVTQGLERSAEALANVGKLVGDTADGLDERLGSEYGDYARRAATAIDDAATSLAKKDADELIDDTREFVRQSPGVALAGAAIIGFALARLIKTGLAKNDDGDDRPARGKRKK
jgi:ElaB/YqjD/DUF883 family membrane-anchored ribosome-binding protein